MSVLRDSLTVSEDAAYALDPSSSVLLSYVNQSLSPLNFLLGKRHFLSVVYILQLNVREGWKLNARQGQGFPIAVFNPNDMCCGLWPNGASQKIWWQVFLPLCWQILCYFNSLWTVHLLSRTVALLARWSLPASGVREDSQWCVCVVSRHRYHPFEWDGVLKPELVSRHSGKASGGGGSTCPRLRVLMERGFKMGLCPCICCVAVFLPLLPHRPSWIPREQRAAAPARAKCRFGVQQSRRSRLAPPPPHYAPSAIQAEGITFSPSLQNTRIECSTPVLGLFLFNYWQDPCMPTPV